jgi:hypothetical protein
MDAAPEGLDKSLEPAAIGHWHDDGVSVVVALSRAAPRKR